MISPLREIPSPNMMSNSALRKGGKLLAEGGGMALLGQTLTARPGGTAYEMAGILPYSVIAKDNRPCSGYRQTH